MQATAFSQAWRTELSSCSNTGRSSRSKYRVGLAEMYWLKSWVAVITVAAPAPLRIVEPNDRNPSQVAMASETSSGSVGSPAFARTSCR